MSKAALKQLSAFLAESDPKKDYRNKTINPLVHAIDLSESSISAEIKKEVLATDPELDNYLSDANYKKASSIMRAQILGRASNSKSSVRVSPDNKNIIIANSFGTISDLLKEASDKVLAYFNTVLTQSGANYVPLAGTKGKLVNLDHIRTVGETKIGRDLYRVTGLDPVRFVSELRKKSYITKTKRTEVFANVIEILSYYSGNQKVFEITGSVAPDDNNPITGKVASAFVNQKDGAEIIKARVKTFREAVEAAIKDVRWEEQAASDSYKDYVFKTLNNAAVKAGATGKIQSTDTKSNKDKTSKKSSSTVETNVETTKPTLGLSANRSPKSSRLSLQAINDYISERLPEAVKANMGPGTLVNRTGRFATSARVVETTATTQGFPSIGYTYQRSPYDVFDRTLGRSPWNTPSRDPRTLIEKSIRDIAKDIAIGRFYTRRI